MTNPHSKRPYNDDNKKMNDGSSKSDLFSELKSLFYLLVLALLIRILIFEPFYIPSPSMEPNLTEGDYVFSTKFDYGYSRHSLIMSTNLFSGRILGGTPERGDVIIFRPPHRMDQRYIKRIVGLPGEKLEIKDGKVYINDNLLERKLVKTYQEDDVWYNDYIETTDKGRKYKIRQRNFKDLDAARIKVLQEINNLGPFHIKEGEYFVLGDNRDNSGDSRFDLGTVPYENIISRARFIFFSFGDSLWIENSLSIDQIKQVWYWVISFRFNRLFKGIYEN